MRERTTTHIKDLREQKRPRSANEMAALAAYYLSEVASPSKNHVTTEDIEVLFKIAGFPLPEKIRMTLPNAKAAGYLDLVGKGEYRLNAVGHNLIAHELPRGTPGK